MAIKKTWNFSIDGKEHQLRLKQNFFTGKRLLELDDTSEALGRATILNSFRTIEYPIMIDQYKGFAVIGAGGIEDIIVDNKSVLNGNDYVPAPPFPKWAWLFIIPCFSVVVLSGGGAIPAVISVMGAMACASLVKSPKLSTFLKVTLCIVVVSIYFWMAQILLLGIIERF